MGRVSHGTDFPGGPNANTSTFKGVIGRGVMTEAEVEFYGATSQGMQATSRSWEDKEWTLPQSLRRNAALLTAFRLLTSRTGKRINLCCLNHSVCGNLLQG